VPLLGGLGATPEQFLKFDIYVSVVILSIFLMQIAFFLMIAIDLYPIHFRECF